MNRTINTVIKLGVIAILLVAALAQQQYSYYTFVRWAVMTSSLYFAYTTFRQQQTGLTIYFVVLAILFNPIKPFWFQKETWHLIDYVVLAITLVSIYFDWTKTKLTDNA
jgi:arginine exporter protein ArgO